MITSAVPLIYAPPTHVAEEEKNGHNNDIKTLILMITVGMLIKVIIIKSNYKK